MIHSKSKDVSSEVRKGKNNVKRRDNYVAVSKWWPSWMHHLRYLETSEKHQYSQERNQKEEKHHEVKCKKVIFCTFKTLIFHFMKTCLSKISRHCFMKIVNPDIPSLIFSS